MNPESQPGVGVKVLVGAAAFVVVVAGLRAASTIVVPMLLAVFLAILCAPPLAWLTRRGVPRGIATGIVLTAVCVAGLGVFSFLVGTVNGFVADWPTSYAPRVDDLMQGWDEWIAARSGEHEWMAQLRLDGLFSTADGSDAEKIMAYVQSAVVAMGGTLGKVLLILFTTVFMLMEATALPGKVRAVTANPDRSLADVAQVGEVIIRYMGIKSFTSLITGLIITLALLMLGVDYALLWGLLAFLLNFVPNIGSIIAAVPAVGLALLTQGVGTAVAVTVVYVLTNIAIGTFFEPRLMGKRMGLSVLVVFLSLVFWGWVLGPVGMFISVPLTMTVKIVLESNDDTRWIAVLMGGEQPAHDPPVVDSSDAAG